MKEISVLLVEMGNTGTISLDFSHPLFTFVAIGLDNKLLDDIIHGMVTIKSNYGFAINDRLHAKRLLTKGKEGMIRELIELLMKYYVDLFMRNFNCHQGGGNGRDHSGQKG